VNKLIQAGRIMFAAGIIALGILCFISEDFIAGRPPVTSWAAEIPGKLAWAYVSGTLLVLAGLAIIFKVKAELAALMVGIMILVCSFLLRHLYEMADWVNAYKALALSGGAFIVAAACSEKEGGNPGNSYLNDKLVLAGCIFLALFFIICGFSHFRFTGFIVNGFIPSYIPFKTFWAYLTAIALISGGVGLIFYTTRKWAALLSGIMILSWFFLLHIPRFIDNTKDASDRMGLCESFTFAGIMFVLAGLSSNNRQ
jgi:uncharacterized membrane protein